MSQENRAAPLSKGPGVPTFSALIGGVALRVASWNTVACRTTMGHIAPFLSNGAAMLIILGSKQLRNITMVLLNSQTDGGPAITALWLILQKMCDATVV